MPKGKKEQVKEIADKIGMSLNSYINLAIDERMEKDKENSDSKCGSLPSTPYPEESKKF